jgi:hypothetical protein
MRIEHQQWRKKVMMMMSLFSSVVVCGLEELE